jgi:3'(2'), 5'-bisphosphate nucleotidase
LIISEEALPEKFVLSKDRVWVIDPIDGSDYYLANDTQYSIMIGLLIEGKPVYGWVYNPAASALYHGGPNRGAWFCDDNGKSKNIVVGSLSNKEPVRVILGRRDIKNNPWLENLSDIQIMQAGGIGYKVGKIFEDEADVFMHLAGRLKIWDTAGPVAVALGAGLEVGGEEIDELIYSKDSFVHNFAIVMGKKGSLDWFRSKIIPSWIQ